MIDAVGLDLRRRGGRRRAAALKLRAAAGASWANSGSIFAVAVAKQAHAEDMRNSRRFTTNLPNGSVSCWKREPGPTLTKLRPLPSGRDYPYTSKGRKRFQLKVLSPSRRLRARSFSRVLEPLDPGGVLAPGFAHCRGSAPRLRAVVSSSHGLRLRTTASASPSLSLASSSSRASTASSSSVAWSQ